jgi:hypothetical protein
MAAYLADNIKVRFLDRNGRYSKLPRRRTEERFSAQDFLMALAEGSATAASIPEPAMPQAKSAPRKAARQLAHR